MKCEFVCRPSYELGLAEKRLNNPKQSKYNVEKYVIDLVYDQAQQFKIICLLHRY